MQPGKTPSPAAEFKRYQLLIKLYGPDKIEHQQLQILATGLWPLLEMRRVHARAFKNISAETIDAGMANN